MACNHEYVPFGFKVYSTDRLGNPEFLRTEDIRCIYCGDVKQLRGEGSLNDSKEEP